MSNIKSRVTIDEISMSLEILWMTACMRIKAKIVSGWSKHSNTHTILSCHFPTIYNQYHYHLIVCAAAGLQRTKPYNKICYWASALPKIFCSHRIHNINLFMPLSLSPLGSISIVNAAPSYYVQHNAHKCEIKLTTTTTKLTHHQYTYTHTKERQTSAA